MVAIIITCLSTDFGRQSCGLCVGLDSVVTHMPALVANPSFCWARERECSQDRDCDAATRCNTLQHAATHYNTLQHTATHCSTLACSKCKFLLGKRASAVKTETSKLQHTATHCSTLQHTQHTATHSNSLQLTSV